MKRDDRYRTVLDALKRAGAPCTAKQVAHDLGLDTSYINTVLNRMSQRGLVRLAPAFATADPGPAPRNWEIPDLPERCKAGRHEWYLRLHGNQGSVCKSCGLTEEDAP